LLGTRAAARRDSINRVTIVAWGNLAPAANGFPPAEALVAGLLPLIYT
jgi:D-alanyl-D-alanine carboxypeptidase